MRKQIKFLLLALILFLSFSSLGFSCSSATLCTNACPKCDLSNAKLRKAYLAKADLRGTNLSGANLKKIKLNVANLSRANLTDTNLTNTDLSKANANFKDAIGVIKDQPVTIVK